MFFKKKPFPTKCEYYKIPLVDLSVKPENTPENLGYLFEYSVIDDSAAYLLSLYEDDTYCGVTGVFSFRYEHDMLRIEGEWHRAPTMLFYLQDKGVMQYEGLYYIIQSELEFPDATSNDIDGKYFQLPGFIASLRRQGDGWDIHRVDADMRAYHAAQYPDTDTQIALEQERELWLNFVQDEQMQDLAQYALLAKAGQTYLHWLESKIKEE